MFFAYWKLCGCNVHADVYNFENVNLFNFRSFGGLFTNYIRSSRIPSSPCLHARALITDEHSEPASRRYMGFLHEESFCKSAASPRARSLPNEDWWWRRRQAVTWYNLWSTVEASFFGRLWNHIHVYAVCMHVWACVNCVCVYVWEWACGREQRVKRVDWERFVLQVHFWSAACLPECRPRETSLKLQVLRFTLATSSFVTKFNSRGDSTGVVKRGGGDTLWDTRVC